MNCLVFYVLIDINNFNNLQENTITLEYIESTVPPTLQASYLHDDWISSIRILPTPSSIASPYFLTGCYDGKGRIWNTFGECIAVFNHGDMPVKSVAWIVDPSNAELAQHDSFTCLTSGLDKNVIGWGYDTESKETRKLFQCVGHEGTVESLSVSGTGTYFATACSDASVRVFTTDAADIDDEDEDSENEDEDSGKRRKLNNSRKQSSKKVSTPMKSPLATLTGHVGAVNSVTYHTEKTTTETTTLDKTLYSCGMDGSVRVWDIESLSNIRTMSSGVESVPKCLSYSRLSGLLVSGHTDKIIRVWDPRVQDDENQGGSIVKLRLASHKNWVTSVQWSPESLYTLVSGSLDGTVKVWDIRSTNSALYSLSKKSGDGSNAVKTEKVFGVDWFGGRVVAGGEDKQLRIWGIQESRASEGDNAREE